MLNDGLDPLDPRFPLRLDSPAPLFWRVLRTWKYHSPEFADAESRRAVRHTTRGEETYVLAAPLPAEDLPAVTFAHEVPYPALAPAALAHEYALAEEATA